MNLNTIFKYFGIFVAMVFILLGPMVIFSGYFSNIPYRTYFGLIIIGYGIFRLLSIVLKNRKNDEEE